jgi:broad specificity phosphatase PhoE
MTAMGTLYLVRHGQASFGSDDYDRLSELGTRQCAALGAHLQARGRHFQAVLRGSLRRHQQSLDAIASALPGLPAALEWPGLNEYDSEALVRAVRDLERDPLPSPHTPDGYRLHFRVLRDGLAAWMAGQVQPAGMPTWPAFVAGVVGALDHVRGQYDGDVLLVSSGGPIATAVASVLAAPPATVIDLNLRLRNSALTEFAFTPKRHMLQTFNNLPHLDDPARAAWITST